MVETRAKQPFIGDQVGLLKPRPPAVCPSKTSDGNGFSCHRARNTWRARPSASTAAWSCTA